VAGRTFACLLLAKQVPRKIVRPMRPDTGKAWHTTLQQGNEGTDFATAHRLAKIAEPLAFVVGACETGAPYDSAGL